MNANMTSVSDVMELAERSTPEHLFWAFQMALGKLIDSHYEKVPADLPDCLALIQRAFINGPTWKRAPINDAYVNRGDQVNADTQAALMGALAALADAIRDERHSRMSGEYSDGEMWRVDEAIDYLAAQFTEEVE